MTIAELRRLLEENLEGSSDYFNPDRDLLMAVKRHLPALLDVVEAAQRLFTVPVNEDGWASPYEIADRKTVLRAALAKLGGAK